MPMNDEPCRCIKEVVLSGFSFQYNLMCFSIKFSSLIMLEDFMSYNVCAMLFFPSSRVLYLHLQTTTENFCILFNSKKEKVYRVHHGKRKTGEHEEEEEEEEL